MASTALRIAGICGAGATLCVTGIHRTGTALRITGICRTGAAISVASLAGVLARMLSAPRLAGVTGIALGQRTGIALRSGASIIAR
jgi:hypothetical protein